MSVVPIPHAFDDLVEDISGGNIKVPQNKYLSSGRFPVVDQGKDFVGGYTDDASCLVQSTGPWVVFGDHTRALKYLDAPFCMGADGVKVLRPRDARQLDAKFLYHFLCANEVPSAGYSRHFKFLRRLEVPLPPLHEQRRIAAILDKADALRRKRKRALDLLDGLTQSIFSEVFGCLEQYRTVALRAALKAPLRNGLSPAKAGGVSGKVLTLSAISSGTFKALAAKEAMFDHAARSKQRVQEGDFLICRGNGNKSLVGIGVFATASMPDTAFPDTMIAGGLDKELFHDHFFQKIWNSPFVRGQIEKSARTTNGTFKINQTALENIEIAAPIMSRQLSYAKHLQAIESQSDRSRTQLDCMDITFASLQHRAFSGQL